MGERKQSQLFKFDICTTKGLLGFLLFCCYVAIFWSSSSCANRGVIGGGPKDTIPPTLINTVPINKSINFRGDQIVLVFDERVQAPQIKRKLIVTPLIETDYKSLVKRNELRLTFDEPFGDSTTYTLNFSDAVEDITESNPARNVVLAFSTTYYIDSMSVNGNIRDLMTGESLSDIVVALYHDQDSLDIFNAKPLYFALSDSTGHYQIENIKNDNYRIYAFLDENRNLTNEPTNESHGFRALPVELNFSNVDSLDIPTILTDIRELELIRSRTIGQYYEIRFSKYVHGYTLVPLDSLDSIPANNLISDNEIIRFYPTITITDSLALKIEASDSVGHLLSDTIYVKFEDDQRRPEDFQATYSPGNKSDIPEQLDLKIIFNKPIAHFNPDSIYVEYDTLRHDRFDSTFQINWNSNRTQLIISKRLDQQFLPDTLRLLSQIQAREDSIRLANKTVLEEQVIETVEDARAAAASQRPVDPRAVSFYFGRGAFISVENDSTEQITQRYQFRLPEDYGIIRGTVTTDHSSYIIQLIDDQYKVHKELRNLQQYEYQYVKPGKYSIRVLIDEDEDGSWFPGNVKLQREPEPIYFFESFFDIRANWELEDIDLTF